VRWLAAGKLVDMGPTRNLRACRIVAAYLTIIEDPYPHIPDCGGNFTAYR
jgi:hypothetical protein